jgi:hypothetical protein
MEPTPAAAPLPAAAGVPQSGKAVGGRDPAPRPRAPAARTSCRSVVHIGDSTSEGLNSADYLPNRADRIPARYAQVGVAHTIMEVSGGTSVVETINGGPNAQEVAKRLVAGGYRGCWVLALGVNDTADVFAGSGVGRTQRIKRMMSVIGDQPVLWVEVKSLVPNGPYAERNMRLWNRALAQERSATRTCASTTGRRSCAAAGSSATAFTTPRTGTLSAPGSSPPGLQQLSQRERARTGCASCRAAG